MPIQLVLYVLKANLLLTGFYLLYSFAFKNLSFFKVNRIYLLGATICSFAFPLIPHYFFAVPKSSTMLVSNIVSPVLNSNFLQVTISHRDSWNITCNITSIIIILGAILFLLKSITRFVSLYLFCSSCSKRKTIGGVRICFIEKAIEPFSFFSTLYINESTYSPKIAENIIIHESAHIKGMHTADIIISEFILIISWFNPCGWLLKNAIKFNIEYIADEEVIKSGFDKSDYQLNLLFISHTHRHFFPAPHFAATLLKKRILIMNRPSSSFLKYLRYGLIIPLILLSLIFIGSVQKVLTPPQADSRTDLDTILPPGAHWHANMKDKIEVYIHNGCITIKGNSGIAEIKCRDTYPRSLIITSYPDALIIYNGHAYHLKEFKTRIPFETIRKAKIYLGKYAMDFFGDKGKNGIVIFDNQI